MTFGDVASKQLQAIAAWLLSLQARRADVRSKGSEVTCQQDTPFLQRRQAAQEYS
jgi:hypothetical protein